MTTPEQDLLNERMDSRFYQWSRNDIFRGDLELAFNTTRMSQAMRDRLWSHAIAQGGSHYHVAESYVRVVNLVLFAVTGSQGNSP